MADFSYTLKLNANSDAVMSNLKQIDTKISKLSDNEILFNFEYDKNIKGFNKTVNEIMKAVPELGIQFQYDVNKRAFLQATDSLKEMEDVQLHIINGDEQKYVEGLAKSVTELFDAGASENELLAPFTKVLNIIETINKNGGKININSKGLESFFDITEEFDSFYDIEGKSLFNLSNIDSVRNDVQEISNAMSSLKKQGAIDISDSSGNKELIELQERVTALEDNLKGVRLEMQNLDGSKFENASKQAEDFNSQLINILSNIEKYKKLMSSKYKGTTEDDIIFHAGDISHIGKDTYQRSDRLGRLPEVLHSELGSFSGWFYSRDFDPPAGGKSMSSGRDYSNYYIIDKSKLKDLNQLSFETNDDSVEAQEKAQDAENNALNYLKKLNKFIVLTSTGYKDFEDSEKIAQSTSESLYEELKAAIPNTTITLETFTKWLEDSKNKVKQMGSVTEDLSFSNSKNSNDELPTDTLLKMMGYTGFNPIKYGENDGAGIGGVIFDPEKFLSNVEESQEYVKVLTNPDDVDEWIENIEENLNSFNSKILETANNINVILKSISDGINALLSINNVLEKENPLSSLEKLKNYISLNYNKPSDFFEGLYNGSIKLDDNIKEVLQDLGVLNAQLMKGGNVNAGGLIGDNYVVKSTQRLENHEPTFEGELSESEKYNKRLNNAKSLQTVLNKLADDGVNVARVLDIVEDKEKGIFYELQTTAKGKVIDVMDYENNDDSWLRATDDQIQKLLSDIKALNDAGIYIDYNGSNISFDEETGFHFFDLQTYDAKNEKGNIDKVFDNLFGDDGYFMNAVSSKQEHMVISLRDKAKQLMSSTTSSIVEGYQEGQHSGSPSDDATELVDDFVDGVIIGKDNNLDKAHDAGKELAESFKEGYEEGSLDNDSVNTMSNIPTELSQQADENDNLIKFMNLIKQTNSYRERENELIEERGMLLKNGQQIGEVLVGNSSNRGSVEFDKNTDADAFVHTHPLREGITETSFSLEDIEGIFSTNIKKAFVVYGDELLTMDLTGLSSDTINQVQSDIKDIINAVTLRYGAEIDDEGKIDGSKLDNSTKSLINKTINKLTADIVQKAGGKFNFKKVVTDDNGNQSFSSTTRDHLKGISESEIENVSKFLDAVNTDSEKEAIDNVRALQKELGVLNEIDTTSHVEAETEARRENINIIKEEIKAQESLNEEKGKDNEQLDGVQTSSSDTTTTTTPLQQIKDKLEEVEQQAKETEKALLTMYRSYNSNYGHYNTEQNIAWYSSDLIVGGSYSKKDPFGYSNYDALERAEIDSKNLLIIDAELAKWTNIIYDGVEYTTDQLAELARESGYAGVLIKNVLDSVNGRDIPSDVLAIFDENKIKSSIDCMDLFIEKQEGIRELFPNKKNILSYFELDEDKYNQAKKMIHEIFNEYKDGVIDIETAREKIKNVGYIVDESYNPVGELKNELENIGYDLFEKIKIKDTYNFALKYQDVLEEYIDKLVEDFSTGLETFDSAKEKFKNKYQDSINEFYEMNKNDENGVSSGGNNTPSPTQSDIKNWKEYDETIALGLDRIEKLQKLSEKGISFGDIDEHTLKGLIQLPQNLFDRIISDNEALDEIKNNPSVFGKWKDSVRTQAYGGVDNFNANIDSVNNRLKTLENNIDSTNTQFKLLEHGNAWTHFGTVDANGNRTDTGIYNSDKYTYKIYSTFEELSNLTSDTISKIMKALTDAGFKGQLKYGNEGQSFSMPTSTDQLVIHGGSIEDQKIAYNVLKNQFGELFSYIGGGFDEAIDTGKSFSGILSNNTLPAIKQITQAAKEEYDALTNTQPNKTNILKDDTSSTSSDNTSSLESETSAQESLNQAKSEEPNNQPLTQTETESIEEKTEALKEETKAQKELNQAKENESNQRLEGDIKALNYNYNQSYDHATKNNLDTYDIDIYFNRIKKAYEDGELSLDEFDDLEKKYLDIIERMNQRKQQIAKDEQDEQDVLLDIISGSQTEDLELKDKDVYKYLSNKLVEHFGFNKNSINMDELEKELMGNQNFNSIFKILSQDKSLADTDQGGYSDLYNQVRQFVSSSHIKYNDYISSEFGNDWNKIKGVVGIKSLSKNSGTEISKILLDINEAYGEIFNLDANEQDMFRQLVDFLNNKPQINDDYLNGTELGNEIIRYIKEQIKFYINDATDTIDNSNTQEIENNNDNINIDNTNTHTNSIDTQIKSIEDYRQELQSLQNQIVELEKEQNELMNSANSISFTNKEKNTVRSQYNSSSQKAKDEYNDVDSIIEKINEKYKKPFTNNKIHMAQRAASMKAFVERYQELAGDNFDWDKIGGKQAYDQYTSILGYVDGGDSTQRIREINTELINLKSTINQLISGNEVLSLEDQLRNLFEKLPSRKGSNKYNEIKENILKTYGKYYDASNGNILSPEQLSSGKINKDTTDAVDTLINHKRSQQFEVKRIQRLLNSVEGGSRDDIINKYIELYSSDNFSKSGKSFLKEDFYKKFGTDLESLSNNQEVYNRQLKEQSDTQGKINQQESQSVNNRSEEVSEVEQLSLGLEGVEQREENIGEISQSHSNILEMKPKENISSDTNTASITTNTQVDDIHENNTEAIVAETEATKKLNEQKAIGNNIDNQTQQNEVVNDTSTAKPDTVEQDINQTQQSAEAIKLEGDAAEKIVDQFNKATEAKNKFVEKNKELYDLAKKSAEAIKLEGDAAEKAGNQLSSEDKQSNDDKKTKKPKRKGNTPVQIDDTWKILSQVGEATDDSFQTSYRKNKGQIVTVRWSAARDEDGNYLFDSEGNKEYNTNYQIISDYKKLEEEIIKADNQLRIFEDRKNEILSLDSKASTTFIDKQIQSQKEYVDLLEDTILAIATIRNEVDTVKGSDEEEAFLIDVDSIQNARDEAKVKYENEKGSKQEMSNAKKASSDRKQEVNNITAVNRALNKQLITMSSIESSYKNEITNQQDLIELSNKKSDIEKRINSLRGKERSSSNENEFLELERLISEYRDLAREKKRANKKDTKHTSKKPELTDAEKQKQERISESENVYNDLEKSLNNIVSLQNKIDKKKSSSHESEEIAELSRQLEEEKKKRDELIESYKQYEDVVQDVEQVISNLESTVKSNNSNTKNLIDARNSDIEAKRQEAEQKKRINTINSGRSWQSKMNQWLSNNTAILDESKEQIRSIITQIDGLDDKGKLQELVREFNEIKSSEIAAGRATKSFGDMLKTSFKNLTRYLLSFGSFYQVLDIFKRAFSTINELDTALTEMRKVSNESLDTLKAYQKETFKTATEIGSTALSLQQATADWMRLGESIEEAKESARTATILLNVSEFDSIDSATEALVSASQAYKDIDKMDIVDVLNNIGNNYSVSTDELATGLQNAAAVLQTQNNTLEQSVALLTAGNAITQDISKTSAGIRTISLRIAGTEEAKGELEELGEDTEDFIVATSAKMQQLIKDYTAVASNAYNGVDILDANGNLRSTYDILLDISQIYQEILDTDKQAGTNRGQALVEAIAGKNRSNIAASILQNPEMLENVYKDAQDSKGSAQEELDKYLDSIDGKISKFQNNVQKLYSDILDSEFLKDAIDFGSKLIDIVDKLIDKFTIFTPILSAASAAFGLNKLGFFTSVSKNDGLFGSRIGIQNPFTVGKNNKELITVEEYDIIKKYNKELNSCQNYEEAMLKINLPDKFKDTAEQAGNAGILLSQYTTQSKMAAIATNVFVTALNAFIGMAIAMVATKLVSYIDKIVHAEEYANKKLDELIDKGEQAASSMKSLTESIRSNSKTVKEAGNVYSRLASSVGDLGKITQNKGSLSTEEYEKFLDVSNQLADIFPELTTGYDDNGNALLQLGDNAETITSQLQSLLDVQKELASQEFVNSMEDVYSGYKAKNTKYKNKISSNSKILSQINQSQTDSGALYANQSQYSNSKLLQFLKQNKISYTTQIYGEANNPGVILKIDETDITKLKKLNVYISKLNNEIETQNKLIDANNSNMASYFKTWSQYDLYITSELTGVQFNLLNSLFDYINWNEMPDNFDDATLKIQEELVDLIESNPDIVKAYINLFDPKISYESYISYVEEIQSYFNDNGLEIPAYFNIEDTTNEINDYIDTIKNNVAVLISVRGELTYSAAVTDEQLKSLSLEDLKIAASVVKIGDSWDIVLEKIEQYKEEQAEIARTTITIGNKTITDMVDDVKNNLSSAFKELGSAYAEIYEIDTSDGTITFSLDKVDNDMLSSLKESFLEMEVDTTKLEQFFDILTNVESTSEDVQQAFNDIATAYLYSTTTLEDLNEENIDSVVVQLEELGIVNAKEVAYNTLKAKQEAMNVVTKNGTMTQKEFNELTYEAQAQLINEANASDYCRAYIAKLQLAEINYNKNGLDASGKITQLKNLAIAYGIANTAAEQMSNREQENKEYEKRTGANTGFKYTNADYKTASSDFEAQIEAQFAKLSTVEYNGGGDYQDTLSKALEKANENKDDSDSKETFDWVEKKIAAVERVIEKLNDTIDNTYTNWSNRNKAIADEIGMLQQEYGLQQQAYNTYMRYANSLGLGQEYVNLIQNGQMKIETITDEDLKELINEYQTWYDKANEALVKQRELENTINQKIEQRLENIKSIYEYTISTIKHTQNTIQNKLDVLDAKGLFANGTYYEQLIEQYRSEYGQLQKERAELVGQLNKLSWDKDSEAYHNVLTSISDIDEELGSLNVTIIETNNNLRNLSWEVFEYLEDSLSNITSEAEYLIDLLSKEDLFDKTNGNFTKYANATAALYAVNYDIYKQQAKDYEEEINSLQAQLKAGAGKEVLEQYNEMVQAHQEAVKSANEEKEAILQLIEDGYNAQLEAIQKVIDKKKEQLSLEKDMYDYQKNIAEKADKVSTLEKQMNAFAGDDSEDTMAKIQQLKVELDDAKKDLEETEYDRFISDTENMLDQLTDDYEEWMNARLDNEDALLSEILGNIQTSGTEIKATLNEVAESNGTFISSEMSKIFNTTSPFSTMLTSNISNIADIVTKGVGSLSQINSYLSKIASIVGATSVKTNAGSGSISNKSSNGSNSSTGTSVNKSSTSNSSNSSTNKNTNSSSTTSNSSKWGNWFVGKKSSENKGSLNINTSIVDRLKYFDIDPSMEQRARYYAAMGGSGIYSGTADQNIWMLAQMKAHGYKTGTKSVPKTGNYWTQENGQEVIIRKSDGAMLTPLASKDMVLNAEQTQRLYDLASGMDIGSMTTIPNAAIISSNNNTTNNNDINLSLSLPNVTNYNEFRNELIKDNTFEKALITTINNAMTGKSTLGKRQFAR